jgi:hypothetical protein
MLIETQYTQLAKLHGMAIVVVPLWPLQIHNGSFEYCSNWSGSGFNATWAGRHWSDNIGCKGRHSVDKSGKVVVKRRFKTGPLHIVSTRSSRMFFAVDLILFSCIWLRRGQSIFAPGPR